MTLRTVDGASSSTKHFTENPSSSRLHVIATPLLGHVALRATFDPPPSSKLPSEGATHRLLIVLDCSGSMGSGSLGAAQHALCEALPTLRRGFAELHLIPFNARAAALELTNLPLTDAAARIRGLRAAGRTNFAAFFDAVLGVLTKPGGAGAVPDPVSIVVLSDGADNHGLDDPRERADGCRKFQIAMRAAAPVSQLHAIGLGKKHDPAMMALLATVGSVRGSFVFARGAAQVGEALEDQLSMAAQSVLPVTVRLHAGDGTVLHTMSANFALPAGDQGDQETGQPAEVYELETFFRHEASVRIVRTSISLADVELNVPTDYREDMEGAVTGSLLPGSAVLRDFCGMARALASGLATDLVSEFSLRQFDTSYLSTVHAELRALSSKLFEDVLPLCARNKAAKADVYHSLAVLRQLLSDLLLPALRGAPVQDMAYARLVDLAYTDVRNKRLRGLLQKRAVANRTALEQLEKDVQTVLSAASEHEIKFTNGSMYGECVYTLTDASSLMREGDCLCLSLDIRRPEAAIADPSRLVVHSVGPTVICSDALLNSLQMRLLESHQYDEGFEVHGGFEKVRYDAEIIPGLARESITGGIPLFVSETHWKVAKLRARPLLGWMFSLDVLGFSQEQLRVLPFLVLDKLRFGTNVSQYQERVIGWIVDVCKAVIRDNRSIREKLFGTSHNHRVRYLHDSNARLPDIVPSNKVFSMQLHVAYLVDEVLVSDRDRKFLAFLMSVEQLRRVRRVRYAGTGGDSKASKGVLTRIMIAGVTEQDAKERMNWNELESNSYRHSRTTTPWRGYQDGNRREYGSEDEDYNQPWVSSNNTSPSLVRWNASRKPTGPLKQGLKEVARLTASICPRLDVAWDMKYVQRVCVLDIAVAWPSGASIRSDAAHHQRACEQAFEKGVEYMNNRVNESINQLKRRLHRSMLAERSAQNDAVIARLFLETPDINEAAGLVRGWLYVGRNVSLVLKVLLGLPHRGIEIERVKDSVTGQERNVRRSIHAKSVLLKMRLLCQGSIGEVSELHADKDASKRRSVFAGLAWRPCKKWVRMLFKKFVLDVLGADGRRDGVVSPEKIDRWVHEFPWLERELRIWAKEVKKR